MHIDKDQIICNVSARKLRDALPDIRSIFIPTCIGRKMGLNKKESEILARRLEEEGYIEVEKTEYLKGYYYLSIKGGALRLANAAKPIKRKTAEIAVEKFLSRVEEVNNSDKYLCETTDIIVFGSFLSDKEYINDVDLAFDLSYKKMYRGESFDKAVKDKVAEAKKNGRNFNWYMEEIFWPYTEVRLYLKSRSRILSFHSPSDGILENNEKKVLYKNKRNT